MNNHTRIEKYVNTIGSIGEGERNGKLYNFGLTVKTEFGLTGSKLEAVLQEVNSTKCIPPLDQNEVATIARSVDKSDKPIGKSTFERNSPNGNYEHHHKPIRRTEYRVIACRPVAVESLLSKKISGYVKTYENVPCGTITIGEALDWFKLPDEKVDAVRVIVDKVERDKLKVDTLPCVIFSAEPHATKVKGSKFTLNGIICLDFDIYNEGITDVESAKQVIANVPYIFAVMLSASGRGLCALACYEGTSDLKLLLKAMQADFQYTIDKQCSNDNRLRFQTSDPDMIVKDEVYPATLQEQIIEEPPKSSNLIGGCFADVKDEFIHWLWHNRLACGMLNCFHGLPDAGKGYLSFSLASIVSTGGTFPDGASCELGTVLILGTEEHYGYAKRKLAAQGANLHNVHYLSGYTDEGGEHFISLINVDKVHEYCMLLEKTGKPRVLLIIVDPLIQMLGCRSNDNSETQTVLTPVKKLAEDLDTCILFVHHDGKGERDSAAQRALGAQSIMGKMRAGFRVKSHDDGTHTVATSKFNIGMRPKAITFKIEQSLTDPEIGIVRYIATNGDFTADSTPTAQDGSHSKAARWLEDFLLAGAVATREIYEYGDQEGFSKDKLKRAKNELQVISQKVGNFGSEAHWIWFLPWHLTDISAEETVKNYLQSLEKVSAAPEGRTAAPFGEKNHEIPEERSDAPFDESLGNKGHEENTARREQEKCPQSEIVRPSGEIVVSDTCDCQSPDPFGGFPKPGVL